MVVNNSTDTTLVKKKTTLVQLDFENYLKEDCDYTRSKESWSITRNKKCSMDQLILYNNLVAHELILIKTICCIASLSFLTATDAVYIDYNIF